MDYVFMMDSDSDLPYDLKVKYDIPVVYMPYAVDGKEYFDDLGQTLDHKSYYDQMRNGAAPVTSALNEAAYMEYFEPILKEKDLLFVAFSSKMSCTIEAVYATRDKLLQQYPERKNIDMDKIPTREPYHLIRNGMTVWVNCYLATREEGGKLLYTNKQLFDTQDPKMQKARADAAEKIYQHGLTGDVDWLCELQHDSRIALKARIDEQGRKLDFAKGDVTEQEGYREYGMLVSTAYEVTQEIKKTENSLIGKYGDREYNLFQTELADLPNGIGFLEKSLDAQKRMLYGGVDTSDAAREMASVVAGKAILQLCAQKQKAKTAPSEFIKGDEWGPINDLATAVQDHGMKKDIPENYLASVNATEKLGTEYVEAPEKIREQIENGTLERRIQTSGVEKGGEFSVTVQDEPPKERRQETGSKEL